MLAAVRPQSVACLRTAKLCRCFPCVNNDSQARILLALPCQLMGRLTQWAPPSALNYLSWHMGSLKPSCRDCAQASTCMHCSSMWSVSSQGCCLQWPIQSAVRSHRRDPSTPTPWQSRP